MSMMVLFWRSNPGRWSTSLGQCDIIKPTMATRTLLRRSRLTVGMGRFLKLWIKLRLLFFTSNFVLRIDTTFKRYFCEIICWEKVTNFYKFPSVQRPRPVIKAEILQQVFCVRSHVLLECAWEFNLSLWQSITLKKDTIYSTSFHETILLDCITTW